MPVRPLRRAWPVALALVVLSAVTAMVVAGTARGGDSGFAHCGTAASGSARDLSLRSDRGDGLDAVLHVPAKAVGRPVPLIVAFHGSGGSGRFMRSYSGLVRIADREGFAVAFPTAPRAERVWRLRPAAEPGGDDVPAVATLLDRIAARACVDRSRISAVGISNGGGFTARLACELSDRLAGVAVIAGGFAFLPPCRPSRRVSVLEIHGTADRVVPYAGDPEKGEGRGAVRLWLAAWARRDGCRHGPVRRATRAVVRLTWRGCRDGTRLVHIAVVGGQHAWPGATPPDPGPSPVDAGAEAWRFLAGLRR